MPEKPSDVTYDEKSQQLIVGDGVVAGVRKDVMAYTTLVTPAPEFLDDIVSPGVSLLAPSVLMGEGVSGLQLPKTPSRPVVGCHALPLGEAMPRRFNSAATSRLPSNPSA